MKHEELQPHICMIIIIIQEKEKKMRGRKEEKERREKRGKDIPEQCQILSVVYMYNHATLAPLCKVIKLINQLVFFIICKA